MQQQHHNQNIKSKSIKIGGVDTNPGKQNDKHNNSNNNHHRQQLADQLDSASSSSSGNCSLSSTPNQNEAIVSNCIYHHSSSSSSSYIIGSSSSSSSSSSSGTSSLNLLCDGGNSSDSGNSSASGCNSNSSTPDTIQKTEQKQQKSETTNFNSKAKQQLQAHDLSAGNENDDDNSAPHKQMLHMLRENVESLTKDNINNSDENNDSGDVVVVEDNDDLDFDPISFSLEDMLRSMPMPSSMMNVRSSATFTSSTSTSLINNNNHATISGAVGRSSSPTLSGGEGIFNGPLFSSICSSTFSETMSGFEQQQANQRSQIMQGYGPVGGRSNNINSIPQSLQFQLQQQQQALLMMKDNNSLSDLLAGSDVLDPTCNLFQQSQLQSSIANKLQTNNSTGNKDFLNFASFQQQQRLQQQQSNKQQIPIQTSILQQQQNHLIYQLQELQSQRHLDTSKMQQQHLTEKPNYLFSLNVGGGGGSPIHNNSQQLQQHSSYSTIQQHQQPLSPSTQNGTKLWQQDSLRQLLPNVNIKFHHQHNQQQQLLLQNDIDFNLSTVAGTGITQQPMSPSAALNAAAVASFFGSNGSNITR